MTLEIADNIWCELQRVCRAVGWNPERIVDDTLSGFTGAMKDEAFKKSLLGSAWEQSNFRGHPHAYFAMFDLPRATKHQVSDEVAEPFRQYAHELGYDPSKLASECIALVTNGIAKKHLGISEAAYAI